MLFRSRVRVVPGAKVEKVMIENHVLKIWIRTAPEDGKANKAVKDVLANLLNVSSSRIQIIKGHTSRDKRIQIDMP